MRVDFFLSQECVCVADLRVFNLKVFSRRKLRMELKLSIICSSDVAYLKLKESSVYQSHQSHKEGQGKMSNGRGSNGICKYSNVSYQRQVKFSCC